MMRFRKAAVAILTMAVVVGPLNLSFSAAQASCPGVVTHGGWTKIDQPPFGQGGNMTAYAVDPLAPQRMWATNGAELQRTSNGGCTWHRAFSASGVPALETPVAAAGTTIESIDIPENSSARGHIYLLVEERIGPVTRTHVVMSRNDGKTWTVSDQGLPPVTGRAKGLYISPSSPSTIYLLLQAKPAVGGDEIYASTNGGESWQLRSEQDVGLAGLAIDPIMPNDLWLWGGGGLYHSTDGGRSIAHDNRVGPPVPFVDVFHAPGEPARIMAYEAETQSFSVSRDGGTTWYRIGGPPGFALSMAHGSTASTVAMSVHGGVFRFEPPSFWVLISPKGLADVYDLSADRTTSPSIFGRTTNQIIRYTSLTSIPDVDPFSLVGAPTSAGEIDLKGGRPEVRLSPGRSRTVPYNLTMPAKPTPLDVFFAVDTTQSMQSTINGLRSGMQQIIDELAESDIDVAFGVGEYKDYPIPGYGEPQAGDFPYRLNRRIGPADDSLAFALQRLAASGGGKIRPESQLTALYQAATGEGEPGFVEPGQEAGFRDEAVKVIVHMTDAEFTDEAAHPSPPFATVSQTLQDENILQIGLAVFGPYGAEGEQDLTRMAEETGAVAGEDGVDCDGNGSTDLSPGDPLVCIVGDEESSGVLSLAPAIIATLKAVTEEVPLRFVPRSGEDFLAEISPSAIPNVNLKEATGLDFTVTFTCPRSMAGENRQVKFDALLKESVIATDSTRVVCKPITAAVKERQREIAEQIPLFLAQQPQPVPVVIPAPVAAPPAVYEHIPAPNPGSQVQGAMAQQKQEQVQLATVLNTFSSERVEAARTAARDDEHNMVAYTDRSSAAAPAALYATAALMSAAYGYVTLARRKARAQLARNRRRR